MAVIISSPRSISHFPSNFKASLLALAGKFDGILLPIMSTTYFYRVIAEEHTVPPVATHTTSPTSFAEIHPADDIMDETESDENSAKLAKMENNHQRACITAFASGTGLAGIIGYGYKALFSDLFGLSLSATIWSAVMFPLAYSVIYRTGLYSVEQSMQQIIAPSGIGQSRASDDGLCRDYAQESSSLALEMVDSEIIHADSSQQVQTNCTVVPHNLTACERFKLVLSLWKYTIPLFTVYAAEYMLQAGVWPAIGFPVTSATARAQFYLYSNWTVSGFSCYRHASLFLFVHQDAK